MREGGVTSTILLLLGIAFAAGICTVAINEAYVIVQENGDWSRKNYLYLNRVDAPHLFTFHFVNGEEVGERGVAQAAAGSRIITIRKDGGRTTYIKRKEVENG